MREGLLKGNETKVVVTMQMPGQKTPMHVPGVLIKEGMTEQEITQTMIEISKFIVAEIVMRGSMRYFPKEVEKIEGLANLLPDLPKNKPEIDDGY